MADAPPSPDSALPLFDERYRWALLAALRWLRDTADVDLDEPAQFDAAYGFMSRFVQEYVKKRGLATKLHSMRIAAIADASSARATVERVLLLWLGSGEGRAPWKEFLQKPEIQEILLQGVASLEPGKLEQRAREKRREFAKVFGLHGRIANVEVSASGNVRVEVAFDEDIAVGQEELKELVINGVPLAGAQLVEVRRNEGGPAPVVAVISVNVERSAIASLRSLPLRVTAMTKDDMRMDAVKMA